MFKQSYQLKNAIFRVFVFDIDIDIDIDITFISVF